MHLLLASVFAVRFNGHGVQNEKFQISFPTHTVFFLVSTANSTSINSPVSILERQELERALDQQKLSSQSRQYQFTKINPRKFVGKNIKPGDAATLNFKGNNFQIVFDRTEYFDRDNVVHWIGHLADNPENGVLFIIEKDSLFGQKVEGRTPSFNMSGVIQTNEGTIRIRPTGQNSNHILYAQSEEQSEERLSLSGGKLDKRARFLEGKIKQSQFLSKLSQNDYDLAPNGTVRKLNKSSRKFAANFKYRRPQNWQTGRSR